MADTPSFHVPNFTSHNPLGSNIDVATSKGRGWLNDTLKSMGIDATIGPSEASNTNTPPMAQPNVNNNPQTTPQAAPLGKQNDVVFEIKQGFQNLNDTMLKIRNDTDLVNQNFTSSLSIQNKMSLALDKMNTKLDRMSKAIENMPNGSNGQGFNPADLLGNPTPENSKSTKAKNQPRDSKGRFVKQDTKFNAKPAVQAGGTLSSLSRSAKIAGIMSVLGAAGSAYEEYEQSGSLGRTASVGGGSLLGGIGGGLGGGAIGTALGGAIGGLFGGVGAIPGAAIGGYLGTAAGGYFGSTAGESVGRLGYDAVAGSPVAKETPKISNEVAALQREKIQDGSKQLDLNLDKLNITVKEFNLNGVPLEKILSGQGGLSGINSSPMALGGPNGQSGIQGGQYQSTRDTNASSPSTPFRQNNNYPVAPGGGRGNASSDPSAPIKEGKEGQYRPVYELGQKDLSDRVIGTIAGEARLKDPRSVDAVINNMFNRLGTTAYGRANNLEQVASAPGQYAGFNSRITPEQRQMIQERIRAIASGKVEDITHGANEYRAAWYAGPWARKHAGDSEVIGGNRFARNRGVGNGMYAAYEQPHQVRDSQGGTAVDPNSDIGKNKGSIPENVRQQAAQVVSRGGGSVELQNFMAKAGYPMSGAWCGEFAASVVKSAGGVPPKNPQVASNWMNYGEHVNISDVRPGDIAVQKRNRYTGGPVNVGDTGSHVGIVDSSIDRNGIFALLGGNQGRPISQRRSTEFEYRRASVAASEDIPAKLNETSPVSLAFKPSSSGVMMPEAALKKNDTTPAVEFTKSSEKRSLSNDTHKASTTNEIRHETKETKKKDPSGVHERKPSNASPAIDDLRRYFKDFA